MKNSIKFRLCSLAAALLLCGCGDDGDSSSAAANSAGQNSVSQGSAGQNSADQNSASVNSASQSVEQNHTAKPRISVKSGEAPKKDDKFVSYDFYGERKVNFNLNGDVNETTKNIVAYSSIKNQYEKLNFAHDLAGLKQKNVLFKFDENLIRAAKNDTNNPNFSIVCADENEVLLANAAGAKFIVLQNQNLIKWAIKMAEFYLFDAKIAIIANDTNCAKTFANLGVDCIILRSAINFGF